MTRKIKIDESPSHPSVQEAMQKWRDLVRSRHSGVRRVDVKYPHVKIPGATEAVEIEVTFRMG